MPSYTHYETANGLPSNEVYDVKQDKQGFLWLGTDAGLVRYDGSEFKLFACEKSRGSAINCLNEDNNGSIWCANFSGQIFYCNNDTLHLFEPFEKQYKKGFAEICIDKNNQLYITNNSNYLFKYNLNNTILEKFLDNKAYKSSPHIATNGDVIFTLLDLGSVAKLSLKKNDAYQFIKVNNKDTQNFLNQLKFFNSYHLKSTIGIQNYNIDNPTPKLYLYINGILAEHPANAILEKNKEYPVSVFDDDEGNLFVGTNNSVVWMKKNKNEWRLHSKFLVGNTVTAITKDKEANYWIATGKNGVYKLSNTNVYEFDFSDLNLKSQSINHILKDNFKNIVATNISGQVFKINTTTFKKNIIATPENRDVQTLAYNSFNKQFYVTQVNTYCINTNDNKLSKISNFYCNSKCFYFRKDGAIFSQNAISPQICFQKNDIELRKKLVNEFTQIKDNIFSNIDENIERISIANQRSKGIWYQEKSKLLWVGFVDGVAYYENKMAIKIFDEQTHKPIIANQFAETSNNELIIATANQGVYFIKNKKIIKHYTTANSLLSNNIKRIVLNNNQLWMIVDTKVQCLDIDKNTITATIDAQDGLRSTDLYDIEILSDTVYVASSKGIQYFPTSIETKNIIAPTSLINYFKADDSLYKNCSSISLAYNTKNIAVQLQAIALKSNGKFTYQYRLLPADTNWITVSSSENIVRYSSLSYGNYIFQSRVLNEDNILSKNNAEISFVIKKPWWLQWWFIATTVGILAFLIYFIYKQNLKKEQQQLKLDLAKSKLEEELRRSQLSSLKAQMNPHFMFNALNSIQEFIILNEKQQANMYMGKFADLMRMTLDMSSKDEVPLEDEIKTLKLYLELEALRFEERFNYAIHLPDNINTLDIYLPSMLVQPYIENAIKHGLLHTQGNKNIEVSFCFKDKYTLQCKIFDNGIGRKRSAEMNALREKKYTSFATGATQSRLELLNAKRINAISVVYNDLVNNDGIATGTEVIIEIAI